MTKTKDSQLVNTVPFFREDEDYAKAKAIVDEALSERELEPWRCDSCGEESEGQFSECWKCGKSHRS